MRKMRDMRRIRNATAAISSKITAVLVSIYV